MLNILGLSLEAEVGSIGGEEDGVVGTGECADPDECKAVADLGVDNAGSRYRQHPWQISWLTGLDSALRHWHAVQAKTGAYASRSSWRYRYS